MRLHVSHLDEQPLGWGAVAVQPAALRGEQLRIWRRLLLDAAGLVAGLVRLGAAVSLLRRQQALRSEQETLERQFKKTMPGGVRQAMAHS